MKAISRRFISMLLIVSAILCMIIPASAANNESELSPAASAYINTVWAEAVGSSGTVRVNFSITATRSMTSLGASCIEIYNSSGTTVKTFYPSTTGGMTGYSTAAYSSHVTWYNATPGAKYYAVVYYHATNSSGHDTSSYVTAYTYA